MVRVRSGRAAVVSVVLATAAQWAVPSLAAAHMRPLEAEELVRYAERIVAGLVLGAEARWNRPHTLIETEYTFEVDATLKGPDEGVVVFTMPGGTVDDVTDDTCLTVPLEVGARYVLFLDDPNERLFSPIVGAGQGAFREVPSRDGRTNVVEGLGGPLPILLGAGEEMPFGEFVDALRVFVEDVEATPWERPERIEDPSLPAREFDADDRETSRDALEPDARVLAFPIDPQPEDLGAEDGGRPARDELLTRPKAKYRWEGQADTPIGWNRFPSNWVWSPHDQYMMSYWNLYGGVVHGVIGPYSKWAFGNGRFDLAGFPGNAQMNNQFDRGWKANELAVAFTRKGFSGGISESDIAVNPAYQWTLDNVFGARADTVPWGFEQTMLHELGHGCGIKHPWETQNVWWDSTMNYAPKEYRMPILFADDAEAIRDAYYYLGAHDGLVSTYETIDIPGTKNAAYAPFGPILSQVNRKGALSFKGNFKIENVGNDHLGSMRVEIYLCPQRFDAAGCRYLKQVKFSSIMPPFTMWTFDAASLGTWNVPADFPLGTYFIALQLVTWGTDDVPGNNASWVNADRALAVKPAASLACDHAGGGNGRGTVVLLIPLAALAARRRYSASRSGPSPYSAYSASAMRRPRAISP